MNHPTPRRFAWLFNRRSGMALLCTALVIGMALIVNLVGIGVVGDVQRWTQWLQDHAGYFFVWRLCLYSATAYLWWRTRARLLQRAPSPEARQRLQHIGIISLVAVAGFEIMTYLRHA